MKNKTENQIQVGADFIGVPNQILGIKIRNMKWSDFKGKVPSNTWFLAHIYWGVVYNIVQKQAGGFSVIVTPKLNEQKAWVDPDCYNHNKLLQHQYGHFLICCLLCLHFKSEMMKQKHQKLKLIEFKAVCTDIFKKLFNHYLKLERLYDQQTNHYLNREQQVRWEAWFKSQFLRYKNFQNQVFAVEIIDQNRKRDIKKDQKPRKSTTSSAKQKFRISSRKNQ